jgi:hypothetical protein
VSRGVRRNALVRASERHVKECPGILGVKGKSRGWTRLPINLSHASWVNLGAGIGILATPDGGVIGK